MLKIKDNVDLKELENYGFKSSDSYYYRFYKYYEEFGKSGTRIEKDTGTYHKRQILHTDFFYDNQKTSEETASNIFDLIKADLVEKVDD